MLIEVNNNMNSNFESRKHGEYSQIGKLQEQILEHYPEVGLENIYTENYYFPVGQKIEKESLERLKVIVQEHQMSLDSNIINNGKTLS